MPGSRLNNCSLERSLQQALSLEPLETNRTNEYPSVLPRKLLMGSGSCLGGNAESNSHLGLV